MKYKIRRVYYKDGEKSPWWKIVIYKNGRPYDEFETQWSSFLYTVWIWFLATIKY